MCWVWFPNWVADPYSCLLLFALLPRASRAGADPTAHNAIQGRSWNWCSLWCFPWCSGTLGHSGMSMINARGREFIEGPQTLENLHCSPSFPPPSPFSLPVGIPSYICNINMTLYTVYGYCIPIKEDLTYSFIPAASIGSCYFHHKESSSMPSQHHLHSFEACTQHHNAHRKGQGFYCNGMMCCC